MHIHTHILTVVTMRIHGSELRVREDDGYGQVCVRLSHIVATTIQFELRLHSGTAQSECAHLVHVVFQIWCDRACAHVKCMCECVQIKCVTSVFIHKFI